MVHVGPGSTPVEKGPQRLVCSRHAAHKHTYQEQQGVMDDEFLGEADQLWVHGQLLEQVGNQNHGQVMRCHTVLRAEDLNPEKRQERGAETCLISCNAF